MRFINIFFFVCDNSETVTRIVISNFNKKILYCNIAQLKNNLKLYDP